MSVSFQRYIAAGNICQDPELKTTAKGTPVVRFSLAMNEVYAGDNETALFIKCEAFAKLAETIAKFKRKGDPVIVCGRFRAYTWKVDGEQKERTMLILVVNEINFIPKAGRMVSPDTPGAFRQGSEDHTQKPGATPPPSNASNLDEDVPF